jgi:hypothetical protein
MIWNLAREWRIPAELLIRPYRLATLASAKQGQKRKARGGARRRAA